MAILQCSGPSMEPTIVSDDIVFSERMSRHCYKIKKYDKLLNLRVNTLEEMLYYFVSPQLFFFF